MLELALLTLGFAVGNVLDGWTTYVVLFKLPDATGTPETRQHELNPQMQDIYKHFTRTMFLKGVGAAVIAGYIIWQLDNRTSTMMVLNFLMLFVVINNLIVYWQRRTRGEKAWTPGKFFSKKLHLGNTGAFIVLVFLMSCVSGGAVFLINRGFN
jgi:hypothetical protein